MPRTLTQAHFQKRRAGNGRKLAVQCLVSLGVRLPYDPGLSYPLQGGHPIAYRPPFIDRLQSLTPGRLVAMKMSSWKRELSPVFSYHLNVFIQRPLPRIQAIFQTPLIPVRLFMWISSRSIHSIRCFSCVFVGACSHSFCLPDSDPYFALSSPSSSPLPCFRLRLSEDAMITSGWTLLINRWP